MTFNITELQVRPIDHWPGTPTADRRNAPFSAPYGVTMNLLNRELRMIGAKSVVLLMALEDRDIRLDGRPRAGATPRHPGVILCFTDRTGPKRFPCDKFRHWEENLRAIALSLEALRKVDRYGVTSQGEQYRGWAALPNPDHVMTRQEAAELVDKLTGVVCPSDRGTIETLLRIAEKKSHPDTGGSAELFKSVQQARKILLG